MIKKKEPLRRSAFFSLEATLLKTSSSCIIATDQEGYIQVFNPSAEFLFNQIAENVIGNKKLSSLISDILNSTEGEIEELIQNSRRTNEATGEYFFLNNRSFTHKAFVQIISLVSNDKLEGYLCIIEKRPLAKDRNQNNMGLLKQFVEENGAGMAMLDLHLKFLTVSKSWNKHQQLADNEHIIGKKFYEVHPEEEQYWKGIFKKVIEGTSEKGDEDLIPAKNDSKRWIRWSAEPWKKEEGTIGGVILMVEDISERKRTEEVIKENELLLRAINYASSQFLSFSNFEAAIGNTLDIIGLTTKVDFISIHQDHKNNDGKDTFSQRFQWSKKLNKTEVNRKEYQNLSYQESGIHRWHQLLSTGSAIKGSFNDFNKEEKTFLAKKEILSVLAIPIFISDQYWGFIEFNNCEKEKVWSDLEESFLSTLAYSVGGMIARNETEKMLIDSRNYLDHIFNSVPIPIFVKNKAHKWTSYNKAWAEFSGVDKNELIGKSDFDLHSEKDALSYWEKDYEVFQSGKENISEEEVMNREGVRRTVITRKTLFKNHYGENFLVGSLFDITDFKKIQAELQNSKDYLHNIINTIAHPIFVKDRNHKYILVNDAFCTKFNLQKEDIIGKISEEIFPFPQNMTEKEDLLFATGKSFVEEKEHVDASGSLSIFITRLSLFTDTKGKKYLVGSMYNVSDLKRKERELRNSKNYLNSIINAIPTSIFVKDRDHKFVLANEACCDLIGKQRDEILGKTDFDFHSNESSRLFWEREEEVFKSEQEGLFEEVVYTKEEEKFLITKKKIFKDEFGHTYLIGTNSDITERKKAEEIIAVKSQILNGILTYLPVVVFRVDQKGEIAESLGAGWKALGLKDHEVMGKNIFDVYPQQAAQIKNLLTKGGFLDFDVSGMTKNKEWHYRTFIFQDQASHKGLIGFGIDVTEAKISERKQKEYSINLEKINKELDQFAYVVSHDLKAPLRAIANLSEWIEEDLGENISTEVKSKIELLRGRVYRLQALINGILDYSKISRSKSVYEEVDLSNIVDEVVSILGVPDHMSIRKGSPLPTVISNKLKMEQVFSNLISNSIKYHDKPQGMITINCIELPDHFEVSVKDDGPGIPPEFHEKIFLIFQTLQSRDKVESTGVGLTIVKKIIEEEGGTIRVESDLGEGAAFIFTLPKKVITNKKIIKE